MDRHPKQAFTLSPFDNVLISNRAKVILHDMLAISLAWFISVFARFNFEIPPDGHLHAATVAFPFVLVIQGVIARHFGLYKGLWRFASLPDLWNIIRAAALGAVSIALALFVYNRLEGIPRSIIVLYPVFLIFFLGGPRLTYRVLKDHSLSLRNISGGQRVIVIGAGTGGEMIVRDMLRDGSYIPVGLVDDEPSLLKARIHGIPVLGPVANLPSIARRYSVDSLIIAVPSANNAQMQSIVEICEQTSLPFRTLPRIQDIVSGKVGLQEIREVSIDDLLGRDKVELDWQSIQSALVGKAVLVTGGGGSIGSELCRQAARLGASKVIVFDHSEFNLYKIERELREKFPNLALHCFLGDVCDRGALDQLFSSYAPRLVFHAAAYKHVPILESQARAAVRNNVLGTYEVINAAERHRCENVVFISSDKAVKPSSIMGATKRFAELMCESKNGESATRYITVRFGNVLGSAGSVVPLFNHQIRNGGPVTVTHPEATRFFMTIPEACQLILQASAIGKGGEIFVLEMGKSINISYLAEQMIRLSGREPGIDIEIVFTGLRPGEKLHEQLFHFEENLTATQHEKLMLAGHSKIDSLRIGSLLEELRLACEACDENLIRRLLVEAVPELTEAHDAVGEKMNILTFTGNK
ncbi:MAG: FlaA1/EpsC-like NDP-sugar epimerase [Gammaproteobacteria bacterium]|jgi:FlaA1/EpsC-like NDP-sugar epimerase